jgi:hypothetical protein
VFGANGPYLPRHNLLFSATLRWQNAMRHFRGSEEQFQRFANNNNVVNRQRILDLSGTYQTSKADSISLSIPIMIDASWSIPRPLGPPPGTRYVQHSSGLSDIVATYRHWVLDPDTRKTGNYSVGFGVKFPTGDPHANHPFPDNTGQNIIDRPVDSSIQPGTGGWGLVFDVGAFQKMGDVTLFASGTYAAEPKNTTGVARNTTPGPDQYYSAPDQYLVRLGGLVPIKPLRGTTLSVAFRLEGVPSKDFIGKDDGFRRPGHSLFIEPGLIYNRGRDTFSLHAPVAIERRREANARGTMGDATFADFFFLVGYQHRFGK